MILVYILPKSCYKLVTVRPYGLPNLIYIT